MRKKFGLFSALLVVLMFSTLLLTACGGGDDGGEGEAEAKDMIADILKRGTMKVGIDEFIPWSFFDKDNNLVGFEIDVATQLAEDLGVEVEFVPTDWAGIIPALLTGKFDVIIGGMGITPERATKVNFTIPYEYSGLEVLCSTKTMPNVTDIEQLNSPDVTLALGVSGTPLFWAEKNLPNAKIINTEGTGAQAQEILNGNADCSLTNPPKYYRDVAAHPDDLYMPFGTDYFGTEYIGFALPKGEMDALAYFNSWITVNDEFLKERADYWYGSFDWEFLLPPE